MNDVSKIPSKWLVKKSKFVWRKKPTPSTNIPLLSLRKSEQLETNISNRLILTFNFFFEHSQLRSNYDWRDINMIYHKGTILKIIMVPDFAWRKLKLKKTNTRPKT